MNNSDTYERDFYAWATEQAALLRAGRLSEADVENIAEEIENMVHLERREMANQLIMLMTYLLKWQVQLDQRTDSGWLIVFEHRSRLVRQFEDNPSLKRALPDIFAVSYCFAVLEMQEQTGLKEDAFPAACPWTAEQVMANGFMPD